MQKTMQGQRQRQMQRQTQTPDTLQKKHSALFNTFFFQQLEPKKKNTAPAILSAVFANILSDKNNFKKSINWNEPLIFLSSDHYIEKKEIFINTIKRHIKYLTDKNIFLFGVKPNMPSSEYGYILMKKNKNIFKAKKFLIFL